MTSHAEPLNDGGWITAQELRGLLEATVDMQPATQRLVLYFATSVPLGEVLYELPVKDGDRPAATATAISSVLKLSTTSTSRSIADLVEAGWLKFADKTARVKFYRIGPATLRAIHGQTDKEKPRLATVSHLPVPTPR